MDTGLLETLVSNVYHAPTLEHMPMTAWSSASPHTDALLLQLAIGNYEDVYERSLVSP